MKLWKFEIPTFDYDEYDSFVVAAQTEEEAKAFVAGVLPRRQRIEDFSVEGIEVSKLQPGIVCSSFNAG